MGNKSSKLSAEQISDLCKITKFSKKELSQWHTCFLKDVPSGSLQKQDFTKTFKHYFPFGESQKMADHVFTLFDRDQDGQVDFKDYITVLSLASRGDLSDRLKWMFRVYDCDEDGYIGRAELLYLVESMYRALGEVETDQESPEKRVDFIFHKMDLDGDGLISWKEFERGCYDDESVLNALNMYVGLV